MARRFKIGDHVTWNSEAGHVSGRIVEVYTSDVNYKGYFLCVKAAAPVLCFWGTRLKRDTL